ncbi:MAG: bifunctional demethylmenaquinone methyltransferase/2-methoxy-6-polyprenyl-1,4-benzoquinol methylase UbiE [Deltaproteobacteria bacterium]|nr:bifunctional demethylmenaquinone methyltransferase/2-methoxy-6-polyprenyl-1,4-benzoquinol methylase UbiE [Deltaproteobacteria bacterium]
MFRLSKKGKNIREMFSSIAPRYDLLNRLLSLGTDVRWRRAAVSRIRCRNGGQVLDIATGTGDMALAAAAVTDASIRIVGVDFCGAMVEIAAAKIAVSEHRDKIGLGIASCESLPFRDDTFDSATIAFGIRNVVDRDLGLREILRVLKPGGLLVVLEFSTPRSRLFKTVYHGYFRRVLPAIGGLFSDAGAYRYLPDSVSEFPNQETFADMLARAGFGNVGRFDLTLGIVTVFEGMKPVTPASHTP